VRYLNALVAFYEHPSFIAKDPIAACHRFDNPRDQEVIGLYSALLAWGRRATTLKKMAELSERMYYQPFTFVRDFNLSRDAGQLDGFKHRTFTSGDAVWFTASLSRLLRKHGSVEAIFAAHHPKNAEDTGPAIQSFGDRIMRACTENPARMRKHLAQPMNGSAAKRLCTYLRWMVRPGPVDLGLWKAIGTHQLILPLDVHSGRQARALGVLQRAGNTWRAAQELTQVCRGFCPEDPARYDFAFFGLGINGGPPAHIRPLAPG